MTHLSDTDIQNLLDSNPVAKAEGKKQHLTECVTCRKSYEAYQTLIPALSDKIDLPFEPDFTDRLLARIPVTEYRKKIPAWAIMSGGLITIGGVGYGLKILLPKLSNEFASFRPVIQEIGTAGHSIFAFFSRNFGSPALIIAAFAAIALVMLIDRFFIQPRLNPAKIH